MLGTLPAPAPRPVVQATLHYAKPLIAATAILTTRHVLIDLQWHYPFHLLVLQLLGLLCVVLLTSAWGQSQAYQASPQTALFSTLAYLLCLPLFIQACLHFQNTAAFAMLSLLVLMPSAALASLPLRLSGPKSHILSRAVFATSSLLGVLYFDYRLEVNGIMLALFSIGGFGILRTLAQKSNKNESTSPLPGLWHMPILLTCLLCTAILAVCFEKTSFALSDLYHLGAQGLLLLVISILAFAALFAVQSTHSYSHLTISPSLQQPSLVWSFSCFASLITAYLAYRDIVIVNLPQILAHFAAGLALTDVDYAQWCRNLMHGINQPGRLCNLALVVTSLRRDSSHHRASVPQDVPLGDDSDDDDESYKTGNTTHLLAPPREPSVSETTITATALTLTTCLLWAIAIYLALSTRSPLPITVPLPHLDTSYRPSAELDIVISMHSETLSTLTSTLSLLAAIPSLTTLTPRIFIYTKNYAADLSAISHAVPHPFLDPKITLRENLGAESETYLSHILTHWNTLGRHTLFLPAAPRTPRLLQSRIRTHFTSETGMLPLSFSRPTLCPCTPGAFCTDLSGWTDPWGITQHTFLTAAQLPTCPAEVPRILISEPGPFLVSAQRVRGVDRDVYEGLARLLVDPTTWPQTPPEGTTGMAGARARHTPDQAALAATVDRVWAPLLQCADPEVARVCASLLSGSRRGGGRRDCQCLDVVPTNRVEGK